VKRRNIHDEYARLVKAAAIADVLDALAIGSRVASGMNRDQWHMAALAARVKPPGKDGRTIAKVVEALEAREAAREALRRRDPISRDTRAKVLEMPTARAKLRGRHPFSQSHV
jgi:hypothetical protein